MRRRTHSGALLLASILAPGLVACGGGSGDPATRACSDYTPGRDGIAQTFCDGPATATVRLDGSTITISGGRCQESAGTVVVNIGVTTSEGFSGTFPDTVGAFLPDRPSTSAVQSLFGTLHGHKFSLQIPGHVARGFTKQTFRGVNQVGQGGKVVFTLTC